MGKTIDLSDLVCSISIEKLEALRIHCSTKLPISQKQQIIEGPEPEESISIDIHNFICIFYKRGNQFFFKIYFESFS